MKTEGTFVKKNMVKKSQRKEQEISLGKKKRKNGENRNKESAMIKDVGRQEMDQIIYPGT